MGDAENALPPSKKRAAGREISRDNPGLDEEDTSELETGTFKKASDEVLASRRIIKARRNPTPAATSSNPFAGIRLIPSTTPNAAIPVATGEVQSEKKVPEVFDEINTAKEETGESNSNNAKPMESKNDEEVKTEIVANEKPANGANASKVGSEKANEGDKAEIEDKKDAEGGLAEDKEKKDNGNESAEKTPETASFSSFQQLSSGQNAFTGLLGTGFSSSTFSFGVTKDGASASCGSGFLSGQKTDQPSFGFSFANNGSSLFGTQGGSTGTKSEGTGFPSMQEVLLETGEENEKTAFTADSVLFEFLEGGWKERGKGELKVNVPSSGTGKARLVMRARGNYRLILNASLFPDMKLANMDKKGITFACVNSSGEGKDGFCTFAVKFKDVSLVDEFRSVVMEHKGKTTAAVKTPENSPKASDE